MDTKYTIKNFRVFDENGVMVQMKPLTVLTGCNSSGKSSIARSALLLNSFLCQIKEALDGGESVNLGKYKIDFTTYPNNMFGTFDNVIHDGASLRQITLEYSVYSLMLSKEVEVQLVFSTIEGDELNNAYLQTINMSIDGQIFFSSSKEKDAIYNIDILKKTSFDFLIIEFVVNNYCGLKYLYDVDHGITKAEYEEQQKNTTCTNESRQLTCLF